MGGSFRSPHTTRKHNGGPASITAVPWPSPTGDHLVNMEILSKAVNECSFKGCELIYRL